MDKAPEPSELSASTAAIADSDSSSPHGANLQRSLTQRQLTMLALGGAIGVGLFLGSSVTIRLGCPGDIITYLVGAGIAMIVAYAVAERAVVRPVAGSFGVYAEIYLNPWAGFAVRYSYWFAQSVAIGSELVAVSIYCHYWAPGVPAWIWIVLFSAGMVFINARNVGRFGEFEYWFALIK